MAHKTFRRRTATVVDLRAFKARRARAAAGADGAAGPALPLFDGTPVTPAATPPPERGRRTLSGAEVEHRQRMLRFLRANGSQ
jgi:hypothetical protein